MLVDRGFLELGGPLDFGTLSDDRIEEATATPVGWIFVRGLSSESDRTRRIR
jgi:hypothetical protein